MIASFGYSLFLFSLQFSLQFFSQSFSIDNLNGKKVFSCGRVKRGLAHLVSMAYNSQTRHTTARPDIQLPYQTFNSLIRHFNRPTRHSTTLPDIQLTYQTYNSPTRHFKHLTRQLCLKKMKCLWAFLNYSYFETQRNENKERVTYKI